MALVVTLDRRFGPGGYMDLGMSLYGFMLAARQHGLDTCAIGALSSYPDVVRQALGLNEEAAIVRGLALGYADPDAPVNQTRTTRCELSEYFEVIRA